MAVLSTTLTADAVAGRRHHGSAQFLARHDAWVAVRQARAAERQAEAAQAQAASQANAQAQAELLQQQAAIAAAAAARLADQQTAAAKAAAAELQAQAAAASAAAAAVIQQQQQAAAAATAAAARAAQLAEVARQQIAAAKAAREQAAADKAAKSDAVKTDTAKADPGSSAVAQVPAAKLAQQQAVLSKIAALTGAANPAAPAPGANLPATGQASAQAAAATARAAQIAQAAEARQQRQREADQQRQKEADDLRQRMVDQAQQLAKLMAQTRSAASVTSGRGNALMGALAEGSVVPGSTSNGQGGGSAAAPSVKLAALPVSRPSLPGRSSLGAGGLKGDDDAGDAKSAPKLPLDKILQNADTAAANKKTRLALVPTTALASLGVKSPAALAPPVVAAAVAPAAAALSGAAPRPNGWKHWKRAKPPVAAKVDAGKPIGRSLGRRMALLTATPGGIVRGELLAYNVDLARLPAGFEYVGSVTLPRSDVRVDRLALPEGVEVDQGRELLGADQPAAISSPNFVYQPYRVAVDAKAATGGSSQSPVRRLPATSSCGEGCYGPAQINWESNLSICTSHIKIGVIDTAVDASHPAFAGGQIETRQFHPEGAKPVDGVWHGTSVLSLLAGSPQSSTPGLIPYASFYAADAFFADKSGQAVTSTASLLDALSWLVAEKGVRIINMSLSGPRDELLQAAIAQMSATGVVFVAAAGNGGPDAGPSYPAAYPQVIAVTAVDRSVNGYRHANQGNYIDVAAPGVGVWAALPGNAAGLQTGTSFAAPYATAVVAALYPQDELTYRDKVLDPKHLLLSRMPIRPLGAEHPKEIYGRGLLQAPTDCARPGVSSPLAKGLPPPNWPAKIERVSLKPR